MDLYYILICICIGLYLVSLIFYSQKILYLGLLAIFAGGTLLYLSTHSMSVSGLIGAILVAVLLIAGPKIEAKVQPDKAAAEKYMEQKEAEKREAEERAEKIRGIQEKDRKRKSHRKNK